jgi:hypothetical protein
MEESRVGAALYMSGSTLMGANLKRAAIGTHLDLRKSRCSKLLDAEGIQVGSDVFISDADL